MSVPPPNYNASTSLIPEYKGDATMIAMHGGGSESGGDGGGETTWQQSLIPSYGGEVKFEAVQGGGGESGNENDEKQAIALAILGEEEGLPILPPANVIPLNLPRNFMNEEVAPLQSSQTSKVNVILLNNNDTNTLANSATSIAISTNLNSKPVVTEVSIDNKKDISKNTIKNTDISSQIVNITKSFNVPIKKIIFYGEQYNIHPSGKIGQDVDENDNYKLLRILGLIGSELDDMEKKKILLAVWNDCGDGGAILSQDEKCEPLREFLVNLALGMMDGVVPDVGIDWNKIIPKPRKFSRPPATVPPATVPPATIPPATVPPATVPPATVPPSVETTSNNLKDNRKNNPIFDSNFHDLATIVAANVALDNFTRPRISEEENINVNSELNINDIAATVATNVALDNITRPLITNISSQNITDLAVTTAITAGLNNMHNYSTTEDTQNSSQTEINDRRLNVKLEELEKKYDESKVQLKNNLKQLTLIKNSTITNDELQDKIDFLTTTVQEYNNFCENYGGIDIEVDICSKKDTINEILNAIHIQTQKNRKIKLINSIIRILKINFFKDELQQRLRNQDSRRGGGIKLRLTRKLHNTK